VASGLRARAGARLSLGGLVANDADGCSRRSRAASGDRGVPAAAGARTPRAGRIDRVRSWPITAGRLDASPSWQLSWPAAGRTGRPGVGRHRDVPGLLRELADRVTGGSGTVHQLHELRPRFTIVRDIPYDGPDHDGRVSPCAGCAQEYRDPGNRVSRGTNLLPGVRPRWPCSGRTAAPWRPADGDRRGGGTAAGRGHPGRQGLGGYHWRGRDIREGRAALRERKHREDKPFAVWWPTSRRPELCEWTRRRRGCWSSARRPIAAAAG